MLILNICSTGFERKKRQELKFSTVSHNRIPNAIDEAYLHLVAFFKQLSEDPYCEKPNR